MSVKAISWAFQQRIESSTQKFVLVALADCADDYGICFPSYNHLTKKTGLSRRSIINSIDALCTGKIIERAGRFRANLSYTSNAYKLGFTKGEIGDHPLGALFPPSAGDAPPLVQEMHHPSAGDAPTSAGDAPTSAGDAPLEPSVNRQLNKKEKNSASRNEFLREINKRCLAGGYKDLGVTSENIINAQGHAAYDHWEGHDKFPMGDVYSAFKGWLRIAIASKRLDQKLIENSQKVKTDPTEDLWRNRCKGFFEKDFWRSEFGAPPDQPDTKVPAHILTEFQTKGDQAHA